MTRLILALFALLLASPALAQGWDSYENARFGYVLDIPPGYAGEGESDNGDGQMFTSEDGTQTLLAFGGDSIGNGFEDTIATAMQSARDEGWSLSYERVTPSWASFSGTRNGIIVYARAIALCGGEQFASFQLEYPERDLKAMNPVVERMVRSLEATGAGASC